MIQMKNMIRKRKFIHFFVLGIPAVVILAAGWSVYSVIANLPDPKRITERAVVESTKIYDRTGKILLYEIHGEEKRTVISLDQIPEHLKQTALVAEDINFYRHHGLDWRGILRAAVKNVREGEIIQGGSTITQQVVKNALLSSDRTFTRKFKEVLLALAVEASYSKDEILELYFNQIPYGSNAYGIASAAQTFFSKSPKELTLSEAALLASLPKAPTYYSPYGTHKEELFRRRDWVLERMVAEGFVSKEEAQEAKNEKLSFSPPKEFFRAPHFVMYVREYLNEKYGEKFVERGGLRVITTLDWHLQEEAEKIIREGAEGNEKNVEAYNAALTAINPKTGEILSLVGSRDYFEEPKPDGCAPGVNCKFDPYVNTALRPRQPGSAFKPFVYATAFKKGYTPETVLFDAPTEFNPTCNTNGTPGPLTGISECYHPRNYDDKFRGPVTLRAALSQSLNLPSVKLLYLAGVEDSIKTAEELGITTLTRPKDYGLSLVLGGAEVTLLEMTSAFGVFSQEGIRHPPTAILRIEGRDGEALEEKRESALPALDTEIARTINELLSDNEARVPTFNPRSSLYFPDRQVAAKTGTTQDSRDAWVIGYTPSLVAGVWAGNNDNSPMNKSGLSIMVAGPIWHRFVELALSSAPPEGFTAPEKKTAEKPILRGLYRTGQIVKIDKISKKLATLFTPPELVEEMSFGEIRSILTYVDKETPLGDPPLNPYLDPQYHNWQEGINQWLKSNTLPISEPPRELDDIHSPDKQPSILFTPGEFYEPLQEIEIKIRSVFPLREVALFIVDELVDAKTAPILEEKITFPLKEPLFSGTYRIKITAYDAVGNKTSIENEITVNPAL